jgi:hypothetical protein
VKVLGALFQKALTLSLFIQIIKTQRERERELFERELLKLSL